MYYPIVSKVFRSIFHKGWIYELSNLIGPYTSNKKQAVITSHTCG